MYKQLCGGETTVPPERQHPGRHRNQKMHVALLRQRAPTAQWSKATLCVELREASATSSAFSIEKAFLTEEFEEVVNNAESGSDPRVVVFEMLMLRRVCNAVVDETTSSTGRTLLSSEIPVQPGAGGFRRQAPELRLASLQRRCCRFREVAHTVGHTLSLLHFLLDSLWTRQCPQVPMKKTVRTLYFW